LKVVIACGGTGGHLFPGIAVAEELKKRGHDPLLLISEKKVDAEASAKYTHLNFAVVPAIAKPPTLSPKMLPFLVRLWRTVRRCRGLIKERGADAVLGMGGFTSLPPVYAGHRLGLATFVHDSNALPGKSNRLTSRFCSKVLVGLEAAVRYFPKREVEVTGTPVREEMHGVPDQAAAREKFGLQRALPTMMVMGGSQGAMKLNTLVVEASRLLGDGYQWLHLAGKNDFARVDDLAKDLPGHHVLSFCDDMAAAYAAADLSVCRSGASSLTEMSFLGLPGILVPYPHAADDHQTVNAEAFEEKGASVLKQEADLDGPILAKLTKELLGNAEGLETMKKAMREMSVDDAAGRICDVVENSVGA
jgi:UDP-N-acetylglucosamine--N-acetylmuramyl-(pentapeptide) pyrophosphoryl-undecaprenol N-acetylglucosamine transferase